MDKQGEYVSSADSAPARWDVEMLFWLSWYRVERHAERSEASQRRSMHHAMSVNELLLPQISTEMSVY
jgi:hypothetical protein